MAEILLLQTAKRPVSRTIGGEATILLFTGAWRERYEAAPSFDPPPRKRTRARQETPAPRRA